MNFPLLPYYGLVFHYTLCTLWSAYVDPYLYNDDELSGSMEHLYIWERVDWLYPTLLVETFGPYGYVFWVKGDLSE